MTEATLPTLHVETPSVDDALASIDREIATAEKSRKDLDARYRSARDQIDTHLSKLKQARRTLLRRTKPRTRKRTRKLDPAAQAGPANMQKVEEAARRHPVATQATLARLSEVGTGSMTWAIKALVQRGVLEPTGRQIDGSKEYKYVPKKRRVLKPGEGA